MKNKICIAFFSIILIISIVMNIYLFQKIDILQTDYTEIDTKYSEVYLYLNSLTYEKFQSLIEAGEKILVYVGRPNCGDCNGIDEQLIKILEDNESLENIYYLNIRNIRDDENAWEVFKSTYGIKYTPTFALFNGGKLESYVEWTPENGINIKDVEIWITGNAVK